MGTVYGPILLFVGIALTIGGIVSRHNLPSDALWTILLGMLAMALGTSALLVF